MSATRKVSIVVLVVAAFAAGILFTTAGANWFDSGETVATPTRAEGTTAINPSTTAGTAPTAFEEAFTRVAESVNPTVVQIRAEQAPSERQMRNPFEGTPFEDFFGRPPQQRRRSPALGSGVIIRSNGYIVTNNHVVANAQDLSVVTYDNRELNAEVVGTDPFSDLAVIKIEETGLPAISFGNSNSIRAGQWVLAFGSPLSMDLENTVTAGIISAVGRVSENLTQINAAAELIQTDAAINPGNSGGPLVNLNGELIGINSAIVSRSGGYQGIGFSIPVNVVDDVTTQLIESGEVQRGYLGVRFGAVSSSLARALDVPRGAAQVTSVESSTPAAEAGLKENDIIIAVDGQQLTNFNQLRTTVSSKRPGESVELTVVSPRGDERTVTIELANRDEYLADSGSNSGNTPQSESGSLEQMGLSLQTVTPRLLQRLGIEPSEEFQGAIVTDIDPNSSTYKDADVRRGDIIVEVDRQPISSREDFMEVYAGIESGASFLVRIIRIQEGEPVSTLTALTKP